VALRTSAVPARLGLKAPALAWPEAALAFSNVRPGQSRQPRLGLGLARPRPRLFYVIFFFFSLKTGRFEANVLVQSYAQEIPWSVVGKNEYGGVLPTFGTAT
jgi:hypothetical protein